MVCPSKSPRVRLRGCTLRVEQRHVDAACVCLLIAITATIVHILHTTVSISQMYHNFITTVAAATLPLQSLSSNRLTPLSTMLYRPVRVDAVENANTLPWSQSTSVAGTPPVSTIQSLNTTWSCHRIGAFLGACVYNDVCHDGLDWYFIDVDALKKNRTRDTVNYPINDYKTGIVYPKTLPAMPTSTTFFPFNAGGLRGKRRTPQYLLNLDVNVTWVDESVWIPSFEFPLDNIYYWTTRIMPLFTALSYNATSSFNVKFPPLDLLYVVSPQRAFKTEWHYRMLELVTNRSVTPPQSMPQFSSNNREHLRVEYGDGVWASHMKHSDIDAPREANWKCFKRAVITGAYTLGAQDPRLGWDFRQRVYDEYNIDPVNMLKRPRSSQRVLLWLRKSAGRSFRNLPDVIKTIENYGIPCTIVFDPPSFREQVELWSNHSVVISAHGAGLMNMLFMAPFSAVVEVYPYATHHNLYPGVAAMLGIAHYPVHTFNGTSTFATDPVYWRERCYKYTNIEMTHMSSLCKSSTFNVPIFVDIAALETAFVNAMAHVGVTLPLRGIVPVRNASTVTGWQ